MKHTVIILSVLVLFSDCCGQGTNNASAIKQEKSSEEKYFVVKSDWEDVKCKEYQENNGFHTIQECIFPNANLKQVYDIMKNIDPNLKLKLPSKNTTYQTTKNGCERVEYDYLSSKKLLIRLIYHDGITYIEINQKKNETQSHIIYSGRNIPSLFNKIKN